MPFVSLPLIPHVFLYAMPGLVVLSMGCFNRKYDLDNR
jgi:hypothetical protein